jgi:DNA-binding PadR family transcriptional regulator
MHSPVNWALLGLIIERPSYAYELAQRFERTYGDALSLSSVSHAYAALGTLKDRGLVEELPGTRTGRQPKPHYRATVAGMEEYHAWLIGQVAEERRRQRVFLLQLTALTRDPAQAMKIISDYEQACLGEACTTRIATGGQDASDPARALQARLIAEEKRLAVGAKIEWARFARSELKALASARTGGAAAGGDSAP